MEREQVIQEIVRIAKVSGGRMGVEEENEIRGLIDSLLYGIGTELASHSREVAYMSIGNDHLGIAVPMEEIQTTFDLLGIDIVG